MCDTYHLEVYWEKLLKALKEGHVTVFCYCLITYFVTQNKFTI